MRLLNTHIQPIKRVSSSKDYSLGLEYRVFQTGANSFLNRLLLGGVAGLNSIARHLVSHLAELRKRSRLRVFFEYRDSAQGSSTDWEIAIAVDLRRSPLGCDLLGFNGFYQSGEPSLLSVRCGNSSLG
jgi:hypothetical protein